MVENADLLFGTYLNILIVFLFIAAFLLFIHKNKLSLTQSREPDRKSHALLYTCSLVGGVTIGTNYVIYYSLYNIFIKNIDNLFFKLSLNDTLASYELIKDILPAQWNILLTIYILGMIFSIISLYLVYKKSKVLLAEWKKQIISSYSKEFPYVYIIINSGTIYGKIEDIFNGNIILLNEDGTIKAIFWKSIEAIEMDDSTIIQDQSYDTTYIW
ncbi:hypothetical protein [Methanococcoides sp. FTZ1]|uniref:hypothetical protein n=1 Tax=Methanococcoides sp. FTZ1 TaxID=3439061 RepID=UPI003F8696D9